MPLGRGSHVRAGVGVEAELLLPQHRVLRFREVAGAQLIQAAVVEQHACGDHRAAVLGEARGEQVDVGEGQDLVTLAPGAALPQLHLKPGRDLAIFSRRRPGQSADIG